MLPHMLSQQVAGSPYDLSSLAAGAAYYPYMYPYAMVPGVALNPGSSLSVNPNQNTLVQPQVVSVGPSAPTSAPVPTMAAMQPRLEEKSVKPCRFWAEGACQYGEAKCKFTHYGPAGSGLPFPVPSATGQAGLKRPAGNDPNDQLKRRRLEQSSLVLAAPNAPVAFYPGAGMNQQLHHNALAHQALAHPALAQQVPSVAGGQMYNPYVMSTAALYGQ